MQRWRAQVTASSLLLPISGRLQCRQIGTGVLPKLNSIGKGGREARFALSGTFLPDHEAETELGEVSTRHTAVAALKAEPEIWRSIYVLCSLFWSFSHFY